MVRKEIKPSDIVQIVSEAVAIPSEDFKQRSRKSKYVDARKMCAVLIREYLKTPFSKIAVELGMTYSSHDTIMYYIKSANWLMDSDKDFAEKLFNAENNVMAMLAGSEVKEEQLSTADNFVKTITDAIVWEEKGTTRKNLYAIYYKNFMKEDLL